VSCGAENNDVDMGVTAGILLATSLVYDICAMSMILIDSECSSILPFFPLLT
jgi:hypothetical protein